MTRMIALFAAAPPGTVLADAQGTAFFQRDAAWISAIVTALAAMASEMRSTISASMSPVGCDPAPVGGAAGSHAILPRS